MLQPIFNKAADILNEEEPVCVCVCVWVGGDGVCRKCTVGAVVIVKGKGCMINGVDCGV